MSIAQLSHSLDFVIHGGKTLSGSITTNTSKNGAMGLLCASLLNKNKTTLHGIPRIEEVYRILEVFESIDVKTIWLGNNTLEITPPSQYNLAHINAQSAGKTRTILMFMGSLIHHLQAFSLPNSQGCKLGKRTSSAHLYGLEELGVSVNITDTTYDVTVHDLKPAHITMYESGDTATENIIMAASLIPGKTTISFASANYMVQDVCLFLQACGVRIEGIGTTKLTIHGVSEINKPIEFYNSEDPIESMMFITAAIVTKSEITIKRCPIEFLELELYRLKKMGFEYIQSNEYTSKNGHTPLVDITTKQSKLIASEDKISARPYPGINMDNLPFFVPIACMCEGETLIHDWVYENRAIYYMELTRLGASMLLADPHRVIIKGVTTFIPAQVVCPPALRPAMIVLLGMLGAKGTSILRNVYSIKRGYEEIAQRLNSLGADIEILSHQ